MHMASQCVARGGGLGCVMLTACAALEAEASGSMLRAVRSSARTSVGSHSMSSMFQSWRGAPYSKGGSPIVRVRLDVTCPATIAQLVGCIPLHLRGPGPSSSLAPCFIQPYTDLKSFPILYFLPVFQIRKLASSSSEPLIQALATSNGRSASLILEQKYSSST